MQAQSDLRLYRICVWFPSDPGRPTKSILLGEKLRLDPPGTYISVSPCSPYLRRYDWIPYRGIHDENKVTSASLVVTGASLVVTGALLDSNNVRY